MRKPKKERLRAAAFNPLDEAGLTRIGEYENGMISYSSRKAVLTDERIGFNSKGQDSVWSCIHGGMQLKPDRQVWWFTLTDDDDWWAAKDFASWDEALRFYLKVPTVVGWDWIKSNNFRF